MRVSHLHLLCRAQPTGRASYALCHAPCMAPGRRMAAVSDHRSIPWASSPVGRRRAPPAPGGLFHELDLDRGAGL